MVDAKGHRFGELDLLRGMACVAVVLYHWLSRGPRAHWMLQADYPSLEPIARYGYLGVHLFFMISGFVILLSAQSASPRRFFASRASRLLPAFWAAASLTAAAAWWVGHPVFSISLPHYLVNLTMLPQWFGVPYVDGVYWSLAYELHFYIYVWIALRLHLLRHLEWLLAGWLLISAINALRPMWPVEFWLTARWAPFFVAGATFFLLRVHGRTLRRFALLAASYLLCLHYSSAEAAGAGLSPFLVACLVTGMFGLFAAIAAGLWGMRPTRLVIFAGIMTYPVYLVHQFFGIILYEQLRVLTGWPAASLLAVAIIVLLVAAAIHYLFERPIGRRLKIGLAPSGAAPVPATPA